MAGLRRKNNQMAVSYKRLWKLLIDRDMKKKDLAEQANLSNYTINKMHRCENVTTDSEIWGRVSTKISRQTADKNDSQRNAGCLFGHKMGTAGKRIVSRESP